MKLNTHIKKIVADCHTPVSVYLALRDKYQKPLLLESSDYNSKEGHYSYICLDPFAEITIQDNSLIQHIGGNILKEGITSKEDTLNKLEAFRKEFQFDDQPYKFCYAGLFGYTSYDAIPYFEDIEFVSKKECNILVMYYAVYSLILVFDHNTDSLYIISHGTDPDSAEQRSHEVEQTILHPKQRSFPFEAIGETITGLTHEAYKEIVAKAKQHCQLGDVFQLVVSKRFTQKFIGDEFNVYRILRNLNPSPYLFYFDFGNYKFFGSSPEAQLVIESDQAEIHPIAGTYKRTGNDAEDAANAKQLLNDPKEQSEHMMLVDLARNDLSKYCKNLHIDFLKQTQFYSHVIHLVSKVKGTLKGSVRPFDVLTGTFPAGTLSGAPKYKAMQLINTYEPVAREFYGGCIGFISHTGQLNHAIMIRTFMSKDYTLYFQAGAGVVVSSDAAKENEEVHNKINVLLKAIQQAEKFNNITKEYSHEVISVG